MGRGENKINRVSLDALMANIPRNDSTLDQYHDDDLDADVSVHRNAAGLVHAIRMPAIEIRGDNFSVDVWAQNGKVHRPASEGPAQVRKGFGKASAFWIENGELALNASGFSQIEVNATGAQRDGTAHAYTGSFELIDDDLPLTMVSDMDGDFKTEGNLPNSVAFIDDRIQELAWHDKEGKINAKYGPDGEIIHPGIIYYGGGIDYANRPNQVINKIHGSYKDVPIRFGHQIMFMGRGCHIPNGTTELCFEDEGPLAGDAIKVFNRGLDRKHGLDRRLGPDSAVSMDVSGGRYEIGVETKEGAINLTMPDIECFTTDTVAPNVNIADMLLAVENATRKMP